MDIEFLLSFREHTELQNFHINITETEAGNNFKNYYKNDKNKYYAKKPQVKKELTITIINKFNLILNKLSETNFNNIIIEYIENINFITINEYEEFQKIIYHKILSEINFINLYLRFIELINYVYNNVLQYNLSYLLNIVDIKFKQDYLNEEISNEKFNFLKEITNLDNRTNNIILIKNLYNYELISNKSYEFYENTLLDNNNFISDIYYWKPIMNEININKLKNILSNNLIIRDKILIENLLNNNNKTELDYIIEDYFINHESKNNTDKLINYINNSGYYKDSISKTNLCKKIIEKQLENNINNILLILLKKLIDNKVIHKIELTNSFKLIKNIDITYIIEFFN